MSATSTRRSDVTEDLTMFRDDHGYVIARDPMDAARLRAEAFAGDPDFATERDAAGFEPVKVRAVIGVREDEHAPVVEKFAGEWIAEKGRSVLAMGGVTMVDDTMETAARLTRERDEARAALDALGAALFVPVQALGYDRAKETLGAAVEQIYSERHALSVAREETIAGLTPRAEFPSPDEVRTVAAGWGGVDGDPVQVLCAHKGGPAGTWFDTARVVVRRGCVEPQTEADAEKLLDAFGCVMLSPEGPVSWAQFKPPPTCSQKDGATYILAPVKR